MAILTKILELKMKCGLFHVHIWRQFTPYRPIIQPNSPPYDATVSIGVMFQLN